LACVVFHLLGGHPAWITVYSVMALAAYVAYVVYSPGPTGSPWFWGKPTPLNIVFVLVWMGAYLLGRQTFGLIPGRLLELFDMANHPYSLTVYVLAPIKEELLYRGILLRRLSASMGFWPALVLSSLVFAVLGHGNPLTAFAMGAWLGFVYGPYGGRSLAFPALLHVLHNLTSNPGPLPQGLFL